MTVFSNCPEPHIADCLTVSVGGGPAEAVFFNGHKVRVPKDCLRIMTHPSVGGRSTGRVRGTGGPVGRRWAAGGPVARHLAARAVAVALPGAKHHEDVVALEGGGGGGGIADVPIPMTARSLLTG